MNEHSEETPDWETQRNRIIGLGETSIRKSYYPELQQRILELEKKNRELAAAYAEQTAVDEELRQQFDETAKKEQELRESEKRFRNLIEASPVPIVLVRDGIFIYANSAFCRMTGYDCTADVMGKNLLDFVASECRETVAGFVATRQRGEPAELHYEAIGLRHDGTRFPYEITIAVIEHADGPVTMAFITDITGRKLAEDALSRSAARLRRAELVAGLGHWELDLKTGCISGSEGSCLLYGLPNHPWKIQDVQTIPLPEYRPILDEALRALVEDNRPYDVEFRIRRPTDGKVLDIHSIAEYDPVARVIFGVIQDITERKRGEDALRESEKKYRNIVETTPDLIWEIDVQGNFTYLSPQILDLFGYRAEDLMGKPFFILIPPDQIPAVKMAFERQVAGSSAIVTLEVIARHADGHVVEMEIRSASATDEQDRLRGFRGVTRDITERKRAEERIRASEEMFRSLVRESADGLSLMDEEGTVIEWNDAMVKISGIPRKEAIGAQQADIMVSMMVPENQTPERIERFRQAISEGQQTGKSVHFSRPIEARILRRDGDRRQIHQIVFPIKTPKGYRIGSIARDITESKSAQDALESSEERYRSLVEITDTGYLVLDKRGLITDANEVYLQLTGRSSLAELIGHSVTEWTAPYDLERNAREVEKCLTTGQVRGLEIDYMKPDGSIQPVEINAAVFNAGSGDVILTLCRDISERKRTNVALQQARNKLNLLNAVTFQDIQTAAFSLSAYQELVKTVLTDAKAKSYVDKQELFLKKMVDTLDFARNYQEMGIHPSRWQNVQQVFLYAISHLDFLHMKQNLQLENLEIFADPLFEKSLFNIMENVLIHGLRATEVTLRYESKPEYLLLIIEDNGVGIPTEEKNMIFDRGYGKGSGLGLFLVREVLSITGMIIKETGTPGKGTRFEILVPKGMYRYTF